MVVNYACWRRSQCCVWRPKFNGYPLNLIYVQFLNNYFGLKIIILGLLKMSFELLVVLLGKEGY